MSAKENPSNNGLLSELVKNEKPVPASAYLEPYDSPFTPGPAALWFWDYKLKLAEALLAPLDDLVERYSMHTRTASVVCEGAFVIPWALWVHGETPSKFLVLWDEMSPFQGAVQVRQRELPAQLGGAICDAWERVLSQTRYTKQLQAGCDGIYYHFGFCSGRGNIAGWTWTPPEATHPGRLAALARALKDYAEDTGQRKTQIIPTIEGHLEWLLTRRPRTAPSGIRMVVLRKGPPDDSAPCPWCGKPLRTPRARQCRFCGKDWH